MCSYLEFVSSGVKRFAVHTADPLQSATADTRMIAHTELDTTTAKQRSKTTDERPNYNCPSCDRPTLTRATEEIVAFRCGACGQLVTEHGGVA